MNTKPMLGVDRSRLLGLHTLGFLVVTLAAYFSALISMSYMLNGIGTGKAGALIGLAAKFRKPVAQK